MASQRFLFADVDGFVDDVVSISETLSNLAFLIELDAENPGQVRRYAQQTAQLVDAMRGLVSSADSVACVGTCS
jgi:hypothetical protein